MYAWSNESVSPTFQQSALRSVLDYLLDDEGDWIGTGLRVEIFGDFQLCTVPGKTILKIFHMKIIRFGSIS